jgi:Helix-turn-helix
VTVFGYYRGEPGRGEAHQPAVKALQAWATASGVEIQLRHEPDQARPSRFAERAAGGPLLRLVQPGDVVAIASVGDVFDYPSDVPAVVRKLAGKGASLRILGLSQLGPLEIVSELASAFAGLEREVERLRDELSVVQQDAEARMLETTREVIKTLGDRFGSFTADLPTLGDVRERRPDVGAAEHIGTAMQRRAEKLGLSQAELSRRTGVPQATVSRVFNTGQGGAVETLAKALWPAVEQPKADSSVPGDGSGAALARAGFGL